MFHFKFGSKYWPIACVFPMIYLLCILFQFFKADLFFDGYIGSVLFLDGLLLVGGGLLPMLLVNAVALSFDRFRRIRELLTASLFLGVTALVCVILAESVFRGNVESRFLRRFSDWYPHSRMHQMLGARLRTHLDPTLPASDPGKIVALGELTNDEDLRLSKSEVEQFSEYRFPGGNGGGHVVRDRVSGHGFIQLYWGGNSFGWGVVLVHGDAIYPSTRFVDSTRVSSNAVVYLSRN